MTTNLNVSTGRTTCCDAYSSISDVEYCKACYEEVTGYISDKVEDLTQPTRYTVTIAK